MADSAKDDSSQYDALDEALMQTFPASDPIAVSAPLASDDAASAEGSETTA